MFSLPAAARGVKRKTTSRLILFAEFYGVAGSRIASFVP